MSPVLSWTQASLYNSRPAVDQGRSRAAILFFHPPLPPKYDRRQDPRLRHMRRKDDLTAARAAARPTPAVGHAGSAGLRGHEGRAPRVDQGPRVGVSWVCRANAQGLNTDCSSIPLLTISI